MELAREATQLQPDVANHWNNLGVARYRAGQWQASVESLEKADSMIPTGDREHRMFLAMAHWQLGNQEIARKTDAEGAAWIDANRKDDAEQRRFREEAEQLMALSELDRNGLIEAYYAKTDVGDPKQLSDRGLWYQSQGEQQLAIDDFDSAIVLQPDTKDLIPWG